jgi:hypothetical protein
LIVAVQKKTIIPVRETRTGAFWIIVSYHVIQTCELYLITVCSLNCFHTGSDKPSPLCVAQISVFLINSCEEFFHRLPLAATKTHPMFGSYFSWKYPNTSRKIGKFIFLFLIICLAIQAIFFTRSERIMKEDNLQKIQGLIETLQIPGTEKKVAFVRLREYQASQFSFDMSGYSDSPTVQIGDTVIILVSKKELRENEKIISSYELKKGELKVFSLTKFNESKTDDLGLAKLFLWIIIVLLILYLIIERAGLIKKLQRVMDSPDNDFQSNKPNFNEFLDR